ncbi:MAG TPA: hypothetical protein VI306_03990 [Pyrinomonadaceae bacterium]
MFELWMVDSDGPPPKNIPAATCVLQHIEGPANAAVISDVRLAQPNIRKTNHETDR